MKGYGITSLEHPSWLEKERPVCGPLDAIVKPVAVAPCSSDTHVMHGGSGEKVNLILGHEAVGEAVEVGALVKRVKPGDFVVVPCTTPDWLAPGIQGSLYTAHDDGMISGYKFVNSKDGVFAEYFHVNQADANLAFLPEGVSPEAALMIVDMMSTGFHAVELAEIGFGDTVAVIGIGPVGLMAIAGAALRGAGRIIAVGTRPASIEVAKSYGASEIVSYRGGDLAARIKEMTGGGVQKTIIAGGDGETFRQAVEMTKAMGTIANVNFFDMKDALNMPAFVWGLGMSNKDIRCGFCPGGRVRVEKLMELVRCGRIDPTRLITHKFRGFDKIEDAFLLMDKKPQDLIKPIVYC
ncbi:MAG: zinc-binding dehydrogenase [Clostridiales Family XIII bacterium]|jgi:threonine dehydrogenase-like Zn-dependent dehydrogenase|nr:zinc-binding dehydrogenase [Clostridiales Family XIII bacterium]